MKLTDEQVEVMAHDLNPGEALKVVAYAGAGKTSTLAAYSEQREELTALYVAFNKSVELAAKRRFGGQAHVRSRTGHGLAFRVTGNKYPRIGNVSVWSVKFAFNLNVYEAALVVRTLENWLNSADQEMTAMHAAEDVKAKFKDADKYKTDVVKWAKVVWVKMVEKDKYFSMSHSGYLKLYQLSKPKLNYPLIMLDEAQDTNQVMFDIIKEQIANGARVLFVGDPFQQIYSWRGAVDAMDFITAPTKHLAMSFRFGKAIAELANTTLTAFFDMPKPLVGYPSVDDAIVSRFETGEKYTIITRTNVELFKQALDLARQKARISLPAGNFDQFLSDLIDVYLLRANKRGEIKDKKLAKFENMGELEGYVEAIGDHELAAKIDIVKQYGRELPAMIDSVHNSVTQADDADVILTTAHKAKGLEWENVKLADDFADLFDDSGQRLPLRAPDVHAKCVDKDEVNLYYVALTRAKRKLIINPELMRLRRWVGSGASSFAPKQYPERETRQPSGPDDFGGSDYETDNLDSQIYHG
jgi:F-box protein 18 (helicase)